MSREYSSGGRLHEVAEAIRNLVANSPERFQPHCLVTDGRRRILEAPVNPSRVAGEYRAAFPGVVADGNHVVEGLRPKLVDGL